MQELKNTVSEKESFPTTGNKSLDTENRSTEMI